MKTAVKPEKEKIVESQKGLQKRKYEKKLETQSWAKLKIDDKHGFNAKMRQTYFHIMENIHKVVLANDMTNLSNRPDGVTKKDVKKKNGYAEGLWSDGAVDKAISQPSELVRFIILQDQEKKKDGFFEIVKGAKPITELKHINQHHLNEYVDWKLDTCAPSTVRNYVTNLQKFFECGEKAGIKSHKILKEKTSGKAKIIEKIPERTKDTRTRSLVETDGLYGYHLEQAKKIIKAIKDNPIAYLAANIFTYVGARYDTLQKMKWSDAIDENGKVRDNLEWLRDGMMKGGRPQIAETNGTKELLQMIYDNGGFKRDEKMFGEDLSYYKMKKEFKAAAERAGVDYKGFHAFRTATVQYYREEKIPEMKQGKKRQEIKEMLASEIMKMVDIEVIGKDGKPYKPHNKMIDKKEPVLERKKGKDGKYIRDRKGNYVMQQKYGTRKDGTKYPLKRTVKGPDGQVVQEPKFTMEKLLHMRMDTLENRYIAEQLSHNRPDSNQPYDNK